MEKGIIKNLFLTTLTDEEKSFLKISSVICLEELAESTVCHIAGGENSRDTHLLLDNLVAKEWLGRDCMTITCNQLITEAVHEASMLSPDEILHTLSVLKSHVVVLPLEDMLMKRDFLVACRLFLTYIMEKWAPVSLEIELRELFSEVVVAFVPNVEFSLYGNKRQSVKMLEERIDYKLLNYLIEADGRKSEGMANLLLGELYTKIFRYDEARDCFRKAGPILGKDARLFLAEARMYENLGILSRAFLMAQRAYRLNQKDGDDDANIEVCLYISYLCAEYKSRESSKHWREIARSLMGVNANRLSRFTITMKEIEALIHIDDTALAHQIVDSAERDVYTLYGWNAPEMARISIIRSHIDGEVGYLRKSNEHYHSYIKINHFNYGYSAGDTAVLYSAIVNDNIIRDNYHTANIFAIKMHNLYAEGSNIAPGVRLSQAYANCISGFVEKDFNLCRAYLDMANKIYVDELRPDEETLTEISSVFHNEIIPKSVSTTEIPTIMNVVRVNILLGEERFDEAKKLIKELICKENDDLERLKWIIHLGQAYIRDGYIEEGTNIWEETLSNAPEANKFEIALDIAESARRYELISDATYFYDQALQADTMIYGKTCDIAKALQGYAKMLGLLGLNEITDETWKQALMLMRSTGDKDGVALLYYSWGVNKIGHESEVLLKKAIEKWEPEPYGYDETLSRIYYSLSHAQELQEKDEEARESLRNAIRLYPVEFPKLLMEGIEI